MDNESGAEFGFKPCGLGRHDVATVGDVHNLLHRHGIESQCHAHLSTIDTTLELAKSTQTANEVDAVAAAKVLDAKQVVEYQTAGDVNVEHSDGVVVVVGALLGLERIPMLVEIHRELVGLLGLVDLLALVLDDEVARELAQELVGLHAVEVLDNTVVVEDGELRGLEAHCHEVVVLLVALVVLVELGLLRSHEGCGCRAMVSVGDIHIGHLGKLVGDCLDVLLVGDYPELMSEAVDRRDEVVLGLGGGVAHDEVVEHFVVGIGEEHRFDVGVVHTHMLHAVFFLVATSEFVLLYLARHIVIDVCSDNKAILCLAVHCLGIDIVVFLVVLHEPAFVLELLEVLGGFLIDARIILARSLGEVDFGFDDMIEAHLVVACLGPGFFGVEHVVGT